MNFYEPTAHTNEELETAINGDGKTLMFLQAAWCGDCKVIKPFVQKFRDQVEAQNVNWIDADRDENMDVAVAQNLRGIPAFVIFENGQQVDHLGNGERLSPLDIEAWLTEKLG
ncbi:thioredoxin family protein [Weissella tructae]|jgi:thiol-disulfide isomerase/thioredoxin|uniref:Thioredoxin family protein n=2 Tax=Weissella TaxID=46255 RepID=A0A075U620_9LACO|nr:MULTISPECIES: thioredoxin family protein [Weissella]AIG65572.1 Thioredoxin family protein [Weissella tructae]AIM62887.1 Thioredoxin family protein [Weissella ceti]AIM64285.1 Thioredoxin family protein [Weissella ceti]ELA06970.1 Thiol-disulfide isomerase and thioredoxin [Weissella ceti NC36]QVV90704.1 thioredoxin family protein [Weissella tructae]